MFHLLARFLRLLFASDKPPQKNRIAQETYRPHSRLAQKPPLPHAGQVLRGRCFVIDGDTIVIEKTHVRLAGIDAPELDHPYGKKAKFALAALCKGQVVTARISGDVTYERVVAHCTLADGTDLSAALVKQGLALDWAKFSGGAYRPLEPDDARRKLWRVAAKHQGRLKMDA